MLQAAGPLLCYLLLLNIGVAIVVLEYLSDSCTFFDFYLPYEWIYFDWITVEMIKMVALY